jgi:hypothetical protein
MLADDPGLEAAVAIARHLNAHRAIVGDDRLAAGVVALVALAFWLALTLTVTQVIAHLGAHRPLDDRLLERAEHRLQVLLGHRSLYELVQKLLRDFELRGGYRLGGRLSSSRHTDSSSS